MSELIKSKELTPAQKNILQRMADGEELLYIQGGGWWIGDEDQTNGRLANKLLQYLAISEDSFSRDKYRIFRINETGKMFLETGYFWVHPQLIGNSLPSK